MEGAVVFAIAHDAKTKELSENSPLVSDPDSIWSWVNPVNYLVDGVATLDALVIVLNSDEDQ